MDKHESNTLELRAARDDDRDFLYRVFASSRDFLRGHDEAGSEEDDPLLRMQFNFQQEHYRRAFPQAETSIVLLDHAPIGSLIVEEDPEGIRLIDIALLPEDRGQGFGRILIRRLLERARSGSKSVRLQVAVGNSAVRLYADLGFEVITESETHHEMTWFPETPDV